MSSTTTVTSTYSATASKLDIMSAARSEGGSNNNIPLVGSPDKTALHRVATSALQSRSVAIDRVDGYVYRTYRLRTSDNFFYMLRCRPPSNVHLLRHEENWLQAEAGALLALGGRSDVATPRLIEAHTSRAIIGSPYLISGPFVGAILSDIEPSLSRQALASIDLSLGEYVRQLSGITGPQFGFVRQAPGYPGFDSWPRAFAFLLETLLRDADDVRLGLPSEAIRDLVRTHRTALAGIITPKLTLLECSSDGNVIVDVRQHRVSGVLDFGTAIWGDPFMSDAFYKPTASFAQGFGKLPNATREERVRQYLYVLYHSLLAIVRHSYRPKTGSDDKEAQRNLAAAMRQLSKDAN